MNSMLEKAGLGSASPLGGKLNLLREHVRSLESSISSGSTPHKNKHYLAHLKTTPPKDCGLTSEYEGTRASPNMRRRQKMWSVQSSCRCYKGPYTNKTERAGLEPASPLRRGAPSPWESILRSPEEHLSGRWAAAQLQAVSYSRWTTSPRQSDAKSVYEATQAPPKKGRKRKTWSAKWKFWTVKWNRRCLSRLTAETKRYPEDGWSRTNNTARSCRATTLRKLAPHSSSNAGSIGPQYWPARTGSILHFMDHVSKESCLKLSVYTLARAAEDLPEVKVRAVKYFPGRTWPSITEG